MPQARYAERIPMAEFDFESLIVDIPDYPEPGVVFKDVTPLFADAEGFAAVVEAIAEHFADCGITKVVGAEARGFMVGAPVAYKLGAGFVPARKPGKLPRETVSESYAAPMLLKSTPTLSVPTMSCCWSTTSWQPAVPLSPRCISSSSSALVWRVWAF